MCSISLVNMILPLPSSHVSVFPDLKFFGGDMLVVGLNNRNLVQKPICPAALGNVLRAVGVENVAVDSMPIPIFTASKLREIACAESLRRHNVCLVS